ncbi:MAG: glycosyltransferase family 4 protein [Candidatus Thorarchaeota archaeon]|nr:glycosyltransferase family 4 protein [Candidatus Thorarchaeota archaeon]
MTMRILHLCDSLNPAGLGGYEAYIHYLSAELERRGHRSTVVTQSPHRDSPSVIKREHYEVRQLRGNLLEARKWEFYKLPKEERAAAVTSMFAHGDLEEDVDLLREELEQLLTGLQPAVVHAHSTYVVFNRVLDQIRRRGGLDSTPLIATVHGLPKPLILPSGQATTDYEQFSSVCPFDMILGVSDAVTNTIRTLRGPCGRSGRTRTLYIGVDTRTFRPLECKKEWHMAFMGRLEESKGVDLIPDLISRLRMKVPGFRAVITGDGSYRNTLLSMLKRSGLISCVSYLGVVPWDEVSRVVNQSRVFVYPSRSEPFGLSIVEAMACGVPVVSSNIDGPREIVTSGFDGVLVPPGNAGDLADVIEVLLRDDTLRLRIGKNARATVEKRFSLSEHASSLLGVYHNAIGSMSQRDN